MSGKQQVILLQSNINDHRGLALSGTSPLNESLCVELNNKTEYIISISVGKELNQRDKEPLGRQLLSITNYIGKNIL